MIATQRHHQISSKMIIADLSGVMRSRVSALAQHPDRAGVSTGAGMPIAGARAAHPNGAGQSALGKLVGEHLLGHRGAADIARADERDMQWRPRHPAPPAARSSSRRE